MAKKKRLERSEDDGSYVVKKDRKLNIVAFVLCFLIAFVIWIYATNNDKKNKAEEQQGSQIAYGSVAEDGASVCL